MKQQPNREVGQKRMNKLVETTKMRKETERGEKKGRRGREEATARDRSQASRASMLVS